MIWRDILDSSNIGMKLINKKNNFYDTKMRNKCQEYRAA